MIVILNHPMVRLLQTNAAYELHICMQNGTWVQNEPFPPDQRGLVAAMSLATDVLAGKIWLKTTIAESSGWIAPNKLQLEARS